MENQQYDDFDVRPVWCAMDREKFRALTVDLLGPSQGVISFVFPGAPVTTGQFWPLWKNWRAACFKFWASTSHRRLGFLSEYMLLPGEPPPD
jgi:hypothetical protein